MAELFAFSGFCLRMIFPIDQTLQIEVFMLRIREGFHPPSSSPSSARRTGGYLFVSLSGKTLPAFDPANIGTAHPNLLYVIVRLASGPDPKNQS